MTNKARVALDVVADGITLGGRVPLPPGRYEGLVVTTDGSDERPVGTLVMATLELDSETAERLGAPFLASTASVAINVTSAIADGTVVVGEAIKQLPAKAKS